MSFAQWMGLAVAIFTLAQTSSVAPDAKVFSEMHWRHIGPTRAGRARAVAGVASQPNVAYIGFDNGGVWRSTDFGSTWTPLFDKQSTGSIGAIAVAQSDPNIIYVGSGAGIIRPDLATGDGMYKSTDAGKTWTHLGLRDSQMIANIDVDPKNPNRLFVAALGHPYGPNPERGIFRSTDGGASFQKVLFKDDYTSGSDVVIDPKDPNIVYAALWQQQEGFMENLSFGGVAGDGTGGIFKSTDGGTTWKQKMDGLPQVLQANFAIAPSNTKVIYAMVAGASTGGAAQIGRGGRGGGRTTGVVGFYKSVDAGEHWVSVNPSMDPRPMARIGGGDLPTLAVDPKNERAVYSASTVFWRTEDAGITWSAVRGAPGGDDYQKLWINPENTNILILVSDQGGVISANRGESWSNWYNQPTGAMYHVTADNAFPYRLCGGQQDSGSACVDSRGMDGQITFHDWHPVDIEEYGMAAPDPKNPDMVYGGKVTVYNRRTTQKATITPIPGKDDPPTRTVRTQPIIWSPKDPSLLFVGTSGVWKTANGGHSWTAISGDLTRQKWDVPTSAGKYAPSVTPAAQGTVTAISPSPLDVNVIWAGTGDGLVQLTTDGGKKWSSVGPPDMKAWTRIFNMDAGHFDTKTAYVAAWTLRLDDLNPHLWRTHDAGKTWTEINHGIDAGAVTNSIREDPRKKGLLYAATDTQVWVSFDDGDNWQSLRLNMPAISVRDIQVKDDESCMCSDLVAGTHGRGFWILDDVTPLRQAAEAASARDAYLFKPVTAIRVRFDTNDPTPWPPEMAAGENPPPGAIVDYYLPSAASGEVKLEFLSTAGKVIRKYSSKDPVRNPDPGTDPVAYDKVCRENPSAPDCGLPLYWPAPQQVLRTTAGMHRFIWDMHYDAIPGSGGGGRGGGGGAGGAVPHRTYPAIASPWVAPGAYQVRLTIGEWTQTQPIVVKLDPRVKVTPDVQKIFTLSTQMENNAASAAVAYKDARALVEKLKGSPLAKEIEAIAPESAPAAPAGGGRGGFGAPAAPPPPPTLANIGAQNVAAVMSMQGSELAPTAAQLDAAAKQQAAYTSLMAKWAALKAKAPK